MARFNFLGRAVDTYGNVKTSVGITIRLTGTTTPATVYNERTGGTGISTEPQITSDSFGRFNFYIDELDYPYSGNQKFDIIAGGLTYEDIEILRGVKIHSSLEELEDDDHPQYAALGQNEIIDGKWLFSHPVSGQAPTEDNHLTTKYYVQLQSESISAASVEQDKRERQATNVQIASVSAASIEQDKRGHAFTLSASASLYENLNTQIASVSAASVEADKRDRRWASDLFISTSAASVEQDKRDRRWATDLFISTSAASIEADRTHKIWADTMFASVSAASREQDKRASRADATHIVWAESMFASTSAASVEQDKRERAFTLSASASLYENLNTQIISVSAASVEQDKRDRRWATDLFISTSAASVEADRTHKIWADTMFASVSAASVEQDKRERAFTVSASASLYENLNTQIASVSAASVEQDKREREATNVQIASVSAASVEQDNRERQATNVQIASVSAASVEQDKRERQATNVQIASVSAASVEQDNRERQATNVQIASVSAASVEQDNRERQATNVQIASVSAASVEQDKRGHAFTLSASASLYENLNTQIASVSAASVEQDKRLLPLDGSRSMEGNLQMNNGLYLETDEVRARDSGGLKLANDAGAEGMLIDDTGNVWIGNGQYLLTDEVRARDSGGLYLRDDAGNLGIFINDGGRVGIGLTDTTVFNGVAGNSQLVVLGSDSATNVANNSNASITIANTDDTIGNTAALHFGWQDTDGSPVYAGTSIVSVFESHTAGQYPQGELIFLTSTADNSAPSEKMRIDNAGKVSLINGTGINEFSIDGILAGNSDDVLPTEKAVKTYSDSISAASVEQDKRGHAFTLSASASLYENLNTQIASVSAASVGADRILQTNIDNLTTDHGELTGLADDDHTQYSLVDGTRTFSGVVSGINPSAAAPAALATKEYVDTRNISRCSVGLSSVQAVDTETWAPILFNNVIFDELNEYNTTTGKFTASHSGYYIVNGNATFDALGFEDTTIMEIRVNTSSVGRSRNWLAFAGQDPSANLSKMVYLAKDDYVQIYAYHNYGASRNLLGTNTNNFMSIHRLS